MNIDTAFPSNYLRAADLNGNDLAVTITGVEMEQIGDDTRPVVHFSESETGLVLNKTNKETIKQVLGSSDTDQWIGKSIVLFPTQVDFQGKQVEAIRIRLRPLTSDPITAFWQFAKSHNISKTDAAEYLAETGGDFKRALELMQAQA